MIIEVYFENDWEQCGYDNCREGHKVVKQTHIERTQ